MAPYKSPELCARCGSLNVAATWRTTQKTSRFNLWSFLITWFDVKVPGYVVNTFDVPVCNACGNLLVKVKKITRVITISLVALFSLLLGIVYLAKGFRPSQLVASLFITLFVLLTGVVLGTLGGIAFGLVIQEALNYEFCSFDGQYYHFKNKKFRREFATLNPSLVQQKQK